MNTGYTPVQGRGFVRPEKQNLQNFAEIIPVISGVIGGRETTIVSARALHKALGVGRVFRSWIKGRIEEYGFTEGVDYEVVEYLSRPDPVSAKSRQQTALEYIITVNMAKELAMVERTEQGRAVRQYFIKCEEELHKVAPVRSAALRRELKARITVASYFKPMCAALEAYRAELGKNTFQHHY
ncbi:antA/AntB antirepressor family protein, partial [Escherichia coli]|nr:antA/AntB antirepressor family protein [Escherichia coli]